MQLQSCLFPQIVSKEYRLLLPADYQRFYSKQIHPLYNGSAIVYIQQNGYKRGDLIDQQGKLLRTISFKSNLCYMRVNAIQKDTIIFETFTYQDWVYELIQWNYKIGKIVHLQCGNSYFCDFHFFPETQLIGIMQRSMAEDFKSQGLASNSKVYYRISYYKFPLESSSDEPVHKYCPQDQHPLNYYDKPFQINKTAGFGFYRINDFSFDSKDYKNENVDYLTIHTYDFMKKPHKFIPYKIDDFFIQDKTLYDASIVDMWEYKPDHLFIQFTVQLSKQKYNERKIKQSQAEIKKMLKIQYPRYILNMETGQITSPQFLQSIPNIDCSIQFSPPLRQVRRNSLVINRSKMFPTKKQTNVIEQEFKYQHYQQIPIYYLAQGRVECVEQPIHGEQAENIGYTWPVYPPNTRIQFSYVGKHYIEFSALKQDKIKEQAKFRSEYKIKCIRFQSSFSSQIIIAFILEEMNKQSSNSKNQGICNEWDQDLVYSAINMLAEGGMVQPYYQLDEKYNTQNFNSNQNTKKSQMELQ